MQEIVRLIGKFWLGKTNPKENAFLHDWLKKNKTAWLLFLFSDFGEKSSEQEYLLTNKRSSKILRKIHRRTGISKSDTATANAVVRIGDNPRIQFKWRRAWLVAAAVTLIVAGGWWMLRLPNLYVDVPNEIASNHSADRVVKNHSSQPIPVALPDGSSVLLYPSSTLRYSGEFQTERNVKLEGKAFFEVARNEKKPFIVKSGQMLTRVLGTSFSIEAFEDSNRFLVTVKTGKVFVTAVDAKTERNVSLQNTVELIPNQQAVFDRVHGSIAQSEIKSADAVQFVPAVQTSYEFKNVGIVEILSVLSKAYGVPIVADEKILAGCALTTNLNNKTLFEKMKIICESVGAGTTFKSHHDRIEIISSGCNM